ncbi:unnamed protein product [Nippostrongylus brasiliensis]|uniref:Mago-bind domain-containing protein n=1 Tax=Nippostrongylus brasiliensis TaxID=27835 RepID=A0A0N4YLP1_NIPBR|nr:unnamed protein product [Nippostrongylus brasiliensis]
MKKNRWLANGARSESVDDRPPRWCEEKELRALISRAEKRASEDHQIVGKLSEKIDGVRRRCRFNIDTEIRKYRKDGKWQPLEGGKQRASDGGSSPVSRTTIVIAIRPRAK